MSAQHDTDESIPENIGTIDSNGLHRTGNICKVNKLKDWPDQTINLKDRPERMLNSPCDRNQIMT